MQGFGLRKIESANFDNINLLDVIPNTKDSQKTIHTFQDFKQWFNSIDLNQTVVEPIKKSKLKNPGSIQDSNFHINHTAPLHRENYSGQYLISGPLLQLGIAKRKPSFQWNKNHDLEQIQRENSIRESSAHSIRSFNGYQQINQYELREKIGKGEFSEVYEGIDVETQQKKKYAIKIMQSKRLKRKRFIKNSLHPKQNTETHPGTNQFPPQFSFREDQPETEFVNNEIAILKKIDHQYITKLYEVIMDRQKGKAYLVLQYCENGFICENKNKLLKGGHSYIKLLESECRRYFKQLVLAINYIHTVVKIAHRDIKPQNILISKNNEVKLSDFGLGTDELETDEHPGTRLFMPPESSITEGKKIIRTQSADIWAMGVTLLIMLTGKTPEYKNHAIVDLNKNIDDLKDISTDAKDFITKCLDSDPKRRITSQEMLSHPWISIDDPFALLIQKSIVTQFEIVISKDEQRFAIKQAYIKKPTKKNYALSLAV